jgi:antitoxin component of MazEF toxin-antitoxin module
MTSDYKKYSLEKLQEWIHDAMNSDASPHEIYSAIREAVREDYYYHKDCISRASGLLELLSGHRPVKDESVDDGMRPWGHSDLEYQIAQNKRLSCDKDDKSPECQEAWNSFWEEHYYPEEHSKYYYDYTRNDPNRKNPFESKKKWVLPVEEVKDEDTDENIYCVSFPDDLLEAANLKEGDLIEWVDQGDGSYLIKKTPRTYDEMIADGWTMTADGFWIKE